MSNLGLSDHRSSQTPSPRARTWVRAQPRKRRHERLTTQHGGLWYHLWVGRRRGWPRNKRGTLAQILPGARGYARGRPHHSVSSRHVCRSRLSGCRFVVLSVFILSLLAYASLLANAQHNNIQLGICLVKGRVGLLDMSSRWQLYVSVTTIHVVDKLETDIHEVYMLCNLTLAWSVCDVITEKD